uniref:Uncharacterized protein n=1 Tax=Steinernema glaseri TaxID=37863 RepID=A0A1I8AS11_9BILA
MAPNVRLGTFFTGYGHGSVDIRTVLSLKTKKHTGGPRTGTLDRMEILWPQDKVLLGTALPNEALERPVTPLGVNNFPEASPEGRASRGHIPHIPLCSSKPKKAPRTATGPQKWSNPRGSDKNQLLGITHFPCNLPPPNQASPSLYSKKAQKSDFATFEVTIPVQIVTTTPLERRARAPDHRTTTSPTPLLTSSIDRDGDEFAAAAATVGRRGTTDGDPSGQDAAKVTQSHLSSGPFVLPSACCRSLVAERGEVVWWRTLELGEKEWSARFPACGSGRHGETGKQSKQGWNSDDCGKFPISGVSRHASGSPGTQKSKDAWGGGAEARGKVTVSLSTDYPSRTVLESDLRVHKHRAALSILSPSPKRETWIKMLQTIPSTTTVSPYTLLHNKFSDIPHAGESLLCRGFYNLKNTWHGTSPRGEQYGVSFLFSLSIIKAIKEAKAIKD